MDSPTEIELTVGALALFHGRLATVSRLGPLNRIVWVEVIDDGGRARTFSVFKDGDLKLLPTGEYEVLDSIVAATAEPMDGLVRLARRAELMFGDPQVGDIFFKPHRYYYLKVLELSSTDGTLRAEIRTCTNIDRGQHTEHVYFDSVEVFQKTFEFKTRPGYDMLAFSSLRSDEDDVMDIPDFLGEWEQPAKDVGGPNPQSK